MQRHRHQEFIRFFNAITAQVPAGKLVHLILDNQANDDPKPFIWTADSNKMIADVNRGRQVLESIH